MKNLNFEQIDDELVLIKEADQKYIKKCEECNARWQKAIKETAIREGWV